ncbi:pyridoxal phosphate-dependent transferase [Aspergillus caelatus]|uniref:Pyridoxal phosphate-dependent transferase n=1 Tax=Aspergillus caelatus TaxID=61420 RepID=A0A5N6ZIN6_9EURO|nr:pyridoxal phosphate-dependent transferase [Aspergillus caelatus]KAE8357248.1 pyridoxal phosphate-dependent transferase [Aspergillus caelatus]
MAHTTASSQIPQHVTSLLSHLTSRPGVQSTFILSRKDGSIIQSTGLLATKPAGNSSPNVSQADSTVEEESEATMTPAESPTPPTPSSATTPNRQTSYQPSQGEALAARIFAFVSSASDLSLSLSRPLNENAHGSKTDSNGLQEGLGNGTSRDDGDGEASEREDDDEVKLLRLRTKKHEIVVVPDKKYLLCVVHDAAHPTGNTSAGLRSSQVLDTVIESITSYLTNTNVQLGATYKTSKLSTAGFANGYEAAAKFINAKPEEICLGVSTTQLLHNLSTALKFQPGDELILSKLNHEANSAAWVRIADRLGLEVKWWSASNPQNPVCDPNDLKQLISEKTRLVACPHASNILGSIVDVKEIAKIVHQYPRAFSWYKVYGPHIAQLYASPRIHDQIDTLGHFFKGTETLDLKLNLASANYEHVQSIPRVVEYFEPDVSASWEKVAAQEERLQQIILDFLNGNDRVTVYGERSADRNLRVPVISFTVRGTKSQRLVEEVEKRSAYGFRSGHMYSHRLIKDIIGLEDVEDGVVRISMLHYNTEEEMTGLVKVLEEVIATL